MNTDFFRDKKIAIIICVLIIALTAVGVVGGLYFINKPKNDTVLVETKEQESARQEKNAQINSLLEQLNNPDITNEERAQIDQKLRELR